MRVSPVGWAYDDLETVLQQALRSAAVTHNHPEGIRGAQAVAGAVFLGRTGASKAEIHQLLTQRFVYDCSASLADLHQNADFDTSCQCTVPVAAIAFLESKDFEDAIRNAVSLGGDTDTLACIAGAMAESYFGGTPDWIQRQVLCRLDESLRAETIAFAREYKIPLSVQA
jgi:ADP-ribosylglycohydrolase